MPIAHFNLAGLLEETGRADDAVASYHRALAADPDFADAHYNLGLLLDALGRRAGGDDPPPGRPPPLRPPLRLIRARRRHARIRPDG